MAIDVLQRGKRPTTVVAGPYGHPFHPILVTVPIGAWVASFVFDIVSQSADEPVMYARASYWLIVLGVVGAAAAAVFGLLDFLGIPRATTAFRTGIWHLCLNLAVVAAFVVSIVLRRDDSYLSGDEVDIGLVVLSAVALAVLGVSGWLGGRLVYRYGVRVVEEADQADGFR